MEQDSQPSTSFVIPGRKRKRTRSDSKDNDTKPEFASQLEALDWGKEVTKKSKDLERKATIALAKSDRQTSDLYRLNRKINDLFCKIMVEKSHKESSHENCEECTEKETRRARAIENERNEKIKC